MNDNLYNEVVGFAIPIIFFFIIIVGALSLIRFFPSSKKNPEWFECPKCHRENNCLTIVGICQECAWADEVARQHKKTIDNIGGCA